MEEAHSKCTPDGLYHCERLGQGNGHEVVVEGYVDEKLIMLVKLYGNVFA